MANSLANLIKGYLAESARVKQATVSACAAALEQAIAGVAGCVLSRKVQHIQETHFAIGYLLCQAVEEKLYPRSPAP